MSKITSPILLDSTGQDIRGALEQVRDVLLAQNAFIDDTTTAADRVWSSKKIVESFTTLETSSGSSVVFTPVAATPIVVETNVAEATQLVLTLSNGTQTMTYECYVPVPGHFNWCSGKLELDNGKTVALVGHSIKALKGANTLAINTGILDATYRVVKGGAGGTTPSWDVIHGGTSVKEV